MRYSREAKASDSQCRSRNCPAFDPSILRHSGILGAAEEAVLNTVKYIHKKGPTFIENLVMPRCTLLVFTQREREIAPLFSVANSQEEF